jgi:hypothetical protein
MTTQQPELSPVTDAEAQAWEPAHVVHDCDRAPHCARCLNAWPCPTARLLADRTRARERVGALEAALPAVEVLQNKITWWHIARLGPLSHKSTIEHFAAQVIVASRDLSPALDCLHEPAATEAQDGD